jgi:signal transduction histidine kinase
MTRVNEHGDQGVRRLYFNAVVLPVVLAALAGAWFVWQILRIYDAVTWIDTSDRVIALVGEVRTALVDREMGLRAFLLTGEPRFLDARRVALDADLDDLQQLLSREPAQAEAARALRDLCAAWEHKAGDAIASPAAGRSFAAMDERRGAVEALREKSRGIVAWAKSTRLVRTRRFEQEMWTTTLGALTVLAVLAGASSLSSRRRIRLVEALMRRERDALGRAQEALRAKDVFLSNLSHELRTPLTPILAWVALARAGRVRGEALERALSSIERNARAQAQIVDDLLDMSRIAADSLPMSRETVDPEAVVRAATEVATRAARAKGVTLSVESAGCLPTLVGDPARLQQIVASLAKNAIKFTPPGGRVAIQVDRVGPRLRIRVADDGVGIAADFLPHVFEDFRQGDAGLTRAHGGLGLGLAIVKHLVAQHGGEIEASSEGLGRGATFTVTLPVPGDGGVPPGSTVRCLPSRPAGS